MVQLQGGGAGVEKIVIARFLTRSDRDLFLSAVREIYDDCEYLAVDDEVYASHVRFGG